MTEIALASLFAAYAAGSKAALSQIIQANVGLAYKIARDVAPAARKRGYDLEDCRAAGLGGLMRACIHYDHTRGTKFSSYAGDIIKASIQKDLGLRRGENVTIWEQDKATGDMVEVTKPMPRLMASTSTPKLLLGEETEATLGDFLTSGASVADTLETKTRQAREEKILALSITFANELSPSDRAIWEEKILLDNRAIKPEALGCNSAARVSQKKAALMERFREYLASND